MSPNELKAVFKRMLLGAAAAPMVLSGCGSTPAGYCSNYTPTYHRYTFDGGGIPDSGIYASCLDATADAGEPALDCPVLCEGRLPPGRAPTDLSGLRGLGGYLARMAHFEAASVAAFWQLAQELDAHGAPRNLVETARASARDEVRHAQAISALASKHGVRAPAPKVKATPARNVFELALDNAREGCVREAFGALIGLYQAEHATDEEVKAAMESVAHDEVAHAAFSLQLARYLDAQLSASERAAVAAIREEALGELLHQALSFQDAPWSDALGLPSADMLFALARSFRTAFA